MTADNANLTAPKVTFTEPTPYGYLYLGMHVDPPRHLPFVRTSARRNADLQERMRLAQELEVLAEVVAVTLYEAVVIPPVKRSPRFDVLALVQTTSPATIPAVQDAKAYRRMDADFAMAARNVRRIGNVDHPRSGAFLFNHFTATDAERTLRTLEGVFGWFTLKAGVRDAALLQPTGISPYVYVNYVRLTKPSFRSFVVGRLRANQIGFAPVIFKSV